VTATRRTGDRLPFTDDQDVELRRRVYELFDLRESPHFRDGIEALVDWAETTVPDRLEREAQRRRRR
jgi:hypothetical protein